MLPHLVTSLKFLPTSCRHLHFPPRGQVSKKGLPNLEKTLRERPARNGREAKRETAIPELILVEKAMATHSSVLAWGIPGAAEPGGPPSMGWHRVGHDLSDLAAAAI